MVSILWLAHPCVIILKHGCCIKIMKLYHKFSVQQELDSIHNVFGSIPNDFHHEIFDLICSFLITWFLGRKNSLRWQLVLCVHAICWGNWIANATCSFYRYFRVKLRGVCHILLCTLTIYCADGRCHGNDDIEYIEPSSALRMGSTIMATSTPNYSKYLNCDIVCVQLV